jgi:HlyD family secretion protein
MGVGFYTARIETSEMERAQLKDLKLVPGMPVEAFVQTGERTALSYLAKPLSDQLNRARREE